MFSIRVDRKTMQFVYFTLFANHTSCGKLIMSREKFEEFKALLELQPPWSGDTESKHHWDDDIAPMVPDSLKSEVANAPWNRGRNR